MEEIDEKFGEKFRRPPTVAQFETLDGQTKFSICGLHTQPDNAVSEINTLVDVHKQLLKTLGIQHFFYMGDFNYGGSYVKKDELDKLDIDKDKQFHRLIDKNEATTVKPYGSDGKPYDRIYVAPNGDDLKVTSGVDLFRDKLSEDDYYKTVSDHYPVYAETNLGKSGGSDPKTFPVTEDEINKAKNEECEATEKDYQPAKDSHDIDDLEIDFYNKCKISSEEAKNRNEEL